jgi:DNA topoisomerase-1
MQQANPTGNSIQAARQAHLRYVTDNHPGIHRIKCGTGFRYTNSRGRRIRDERVLSRIRKLAIPPAWTDVWICPNPNGHLQATGRDARGRKQHRYHERWRAVRDENKFERIISFAQALPVIRRRVRHDLKAPALSREKVLAAIVRLLETTRMRVGNEEYARQNHSHGLTTLRDAHAQIRKGEITFDFRGKGGARRHVKVHDPRLAHIVKQCQEVPGQVLFQYLDADGTRHRVTSDDVNAYLKETSGGEFTAKDFRTWAATLLAARIFATMLESGASPATKRSLLNGIQQVAEQLGHTPAICRKCYIHPAVIEAYVDGSVMALAGKKGRGPIKEAVLLRWLRRRLGA